MERSFKCSRSYQRLRKHRFPNEKQTSRLVSLPRAAGERDRAIDGVRRSLASAPVQNGVRRQLQTVSVSNGNRASDGRGRSAETWGPPGRRTLSKRNRESNPRRERVNLPGEFAP